MSNRKVCWEVSVDSTKRASSRLRDALAICDGEIHSKFALAPNATSFILVYLDPEKIEEFRNIAKPIDIRYRAPTTFDHGTLRPLYATPGEELLARSRASTGPMQFGDDWPGVFLRGDYAVPMAIILSATLDAIEKGERVTRVSIVQLRELAEMLGSAEPAGGAATLKPYEECRTAST